MNFSIVTPAQPQPWKNSIFNLPKKPSHLALPGLHPFPGIDLTRPFSLQIFIHPGQRQWHPRSGRILGWSPSPGRLHAPSSDELAIPASGDVETGQLREGGVQGTLGPRRASSLARVDLHLQRLRHRAVDVAQRPLSRQLAHGGLLRQAESRVLLRKGLARRCNGWVHGGV